MSRRGRAADVFCLLLALLCCHGHSDRQHHQASSNSLPRCSSGGGGGGDDDVGGCHAAANALLASAAKPEWWQFLHRAEEGRLSRRQLVEEAVVLVDAVGRCNGTVSSSAWSKLLELTWGYLRSPSLTIRTVAAATAAANGTLPSAAHAMLSQLENELQLLLSKGGGASFRPSTIDWRDDGPHLPAAPPGQCGVHAYPQEGDCGLRILPSLTPEGGLTVECLRDLAGHEAFVVRGGVSPALAAAFDRMSLLQVAAHGKIRSFAVEGLADPARLANEGSTNVVSLGTFLASAAEDGSYSFGGELLRTHMKELLSGGADAGGKSLLVLPPTLRPWLGGEPLHLALAMSHNGTSGGLHFHQHGATLHLALTGSPKRWLLYPPTPDYWSQYNADLQGLSHADLTYGVMEAEADDGAAAHDNIETLQPPRSSMAWIRDRLPELPHFARPFQCTLKAGDALFVPAMWPHATVVEGGESIGLAVREGWLDYFKKMAGGPGSSEDGATEELLLRMPGDNNGGSGYHVLV
eukprot:SAG31_NODE_477_length_15150_cov_13.611772_9_plen_521_part_00